MFIMSLAAADLTVGAIVMPISSVYALTGKPIRIGSRPFCRAYTKNASLAPLTPHTDFKYHTVHAPQEFRRHTFSRGDFLTLTSFNHFHLQTTLAKLPIIPILAI
jgi:hypothetical protein